MFIEAFPGLQTLSCKALRLGEWLSEEKLGSLRSPWGTGSEIFTAVYLVGWFALNSPSWQHRWSPECQRRGLSLGLAPPHVGRELEVTVLA